MFQDCTSLTTVDLSNLDYVGGDYACQQMFLGCTSLTSANLSSLRILNNQYVIGAMFQGCSNLTSVDLSSFEMVNANYVCASTFENCTSLTTVDFPSLKTMQYSSTFTSAFAGCTSLTRVSFYALTPSSFGSRTNQFNSMLNGCTNVTVHFPMAIQATIGSWSAVTGGFGGTNTTVLFDIVTSLTGADSNTYTRQQKNSTGTATAWTYNSTVYYTSGTTEPTVGATIYSDSACTTAVTTISAIA
jgi:hypothetical protein